MKPGTTTQRSYSLRSKKESKPRLPIHRTFYDRQYEFVSAEDQYVAFVGGVGSGKSMAGAARALAAAYGRIGTRPIRTPNLGVITAPTYRMLEDATIRTFFEVAEGRIVDFVKSGVKAVLDNGSEILFRSVEDPEKLRGINASWWFADEAAMYAPVTWNIGIGRLRQFDDSPGYAWLTTTPKGRNWIYKTFAQEKRPGYRLMRARTTENPFLAPEFVAALKESYTGDFARQELDAEFVSFEGLIYPEYDVATHRYVTPVPRERIVRVAAGVDWGYTNPGVILVGGLDSDGRLYVMYEEYKRQRLIEDWIGVAKQLNEIYTIDTFYCDPAEPTYIARFIDAGLNAQKADNSINEGIQAVKSRLVRREDGLPRLVMQSDCANLLTEFEQYQWMAGRDGIMRDQPTKANDHAMDALRYLVRGVENEVPVITMNAVRVM